VYFPKQDHLAVNGRCRYVVAIAIALAFISALQLVHLPSETDASSPASTTPWRERIFPADKNIDNKDSKPTGTTDGNEESWSTETTTLPLASPTVTMVPEEQVDPQEICSSEAAWKQVPFSDLNTTITVPENIKYDPAGPRPDQVILLTATDGQGYNGAIKNVVQLAVENRKAYCKHHGYIYHFIDISKYDLGGSHAVWKKIPAIVEAFNTYPDAQWVFWLDLDAIIMTPEQDLNSLLLSKSAMQKALAVGDRHHGPGWEPLSTFQQAVVDFENTDMLIAQDHNGVNAGSFLIRRSKYTRWLLDMWADPFFMHMTWHAREQETLVRTHLCLVLKSFC